MLEFVGGLILGLALMAAGGAWRARSKEAQHAQLHEADAQLGLRLDTALRELDALTGKSTEDAEQAAASLAEARDEVRRLREALDALRQEAASAQERLARAQQGLEAARQELMELKKVEQTFERWHHAMDALLTHNKGMHDKNGDFARIVRHMIIVTLNASIEAARAGEYGRGFAVVAEEMRGLAASAGKLSQDYGQALHENDLITIATFQDVQASGRLIIGALTNMELSNRRLNDDVVGQA